MTVPPDNPSAAYRGDGVTTSYPFAFRVLAPLDVRVELDGTALEAGFTVTLTGSGGTVQFASAPAANALVEITRFTRIERATDFAEGGTLTSAALNAEFDRVFMVLQEIGQERLPPGEPSRLVIWNAAGDELINGPTVDQVQAVQTDAVTRTEAAATRALLSAAQAEATLQNIQTMLEAGAGSPSGDIGGGLAWMEFVVGMTARMVELSTLVFDLQQAIKGGEHEH